MIFIDSIQNGTNGLRLAPAWRIIRRRRGMDTDSHLQAKCCTCMLATAGGSEKPVVSVAQSHRIHNSLLRALLCRLFGRLVSV
jgi:hypothetical protein